MNYSSTLLHTVADVGDGIFMERVLETLFVHRLDGEGILREC